MANAVPSSCVNGRLSSSSSSSALSLVLSLLLPLLLSLLSLLSDEESAASAIAAVSGTFIAMSVFNSEMSSSL